MTAHFPTARKTEYLTRFEVACWYPDWEGGYDVGQHSFGRDGFCNTCGQSLAKIERVRARQALEFGLDYLL